MNKDSSTYHLWSIDFVGLLRSKKYHFLPLHTPEAHQHAQEES
jgi:hypothetical protein